jgi:hypothetical protein
VVLKYVTNIIGRKNYDGVKQIVVFEALVMDGSVK